MNKNIRLTREQLEGQDNFNYMLKSAYEDFEKSLEKVRAEKATHVSHFLIFDYLTNACCCTGVGGEIHG